MRRMLYAFTTLYLAGCTPSPPPARYQQAYEGCTPDNGTCADGTQCLARWADTWPVCDPTDLPFGRDCSTTHVCPERPGSRTLCLRDQCYIRCDRGEPCPTATYCHVVDFQNESGVQTICTP